MDRSSDPCSSWIPYQGGQRVFVREVLGSELADKGRLATAWETEGRRGWLGQGTPGPVVPGEVLNF